MSIPASNIVSVTPRVITAGGTDLEFAGLFITKNELCVFPGAMSFSSSAEVASYFGADSEEYLAATKYFLGYDDSFRKPLTVYFARSALDGLAGSLIGGAADSLAELKAITNGELTITVDGEELSLTGLDFSACATQSDIAVLLEEKMAQSGEDSGVVGTAVAGTAEVGNEGNDLIATVEYSSQTGGFIVTSATTGENSAVSFATGDTADALGLSEDTGAVVSKGSEALTPSGVMEAVVNEVTNWVSFTTLYKPDDEEILGYCEWSNAQDVDYLYVPWTEDESDTLTTNASNLPNQILEADYEGVAMVYGGMIYAAFIMGAVGSIDWTRTNGLVTLKFKSQDGLAASVTDTTTANNLLSMNVNYYGRYATRADDFTILAEGTMMGGDYGYIDAFLGMVWLKNNIQLSCMNGFTSVGRVPYNDAGYTIIRSWCADTIDTAKTNGVIQAGVSLSQSQKAQLYNEIGEDVSNTIYTDGYYLMVSDPGATARANRESPTIGLWFTYGGAVHKLDIPLTMIE